MGIRHLTLWVYPPKCEPNATEKDPTPLIKKGRFLHFLPAGARGRIFHLFPVKKVLTSHRKCAIIIIQKGVDTKWHLPKQNSLNWQSMTKW